MHDDELRRLLLRIDPKGREALRQLMRAEQWERDQFSTSLIRLGTRASSDLADLIDLTTINSEMRRRLARTLGELEAAP
jgi:hypothetical protein